MANKLWTFGCSFTEGGGLDNPYPDLKLGTQWWKPEYREAIWPTLLKKDYGHNVVNRGRSGSGIIAMLFELIININNIKKGDKVFISLTSPSRFLHYSSMVDKNNIDKMLGLHHLPAGHHIVNQYFDDTLDEEHIGDPSDCYEALDIDQKKTLVEYMLLFNTDKLVAPKPYEGDVERTKEWYTQADAEYNLGEILIDKIRELLRDRGVESYLWTWKLWGYGESDPKLYDGYFETINKWSNFKHSDSHWSPNGHRRVTDFFQWCIENKRYEIDRDLADEWKSTYNQNHSYISYNDKLI